MQAESKGLFGSIADTFSGGKKVKKETPNPVAASATTSSEGTMAKPQSYFTVQPHEFTIKGRKGAEDTKVTDHALFFEHSIMEVEFKPLPTVPARTKYLRLDTLKEIASILEGGYAENVSEILLKDRGHKELAQVLKDNKIPVLDFLSWLDEEVKKIPAKAKGRKAGTKAPKAKADSSIRALVSMLAGIPSVSPEEALEQLKGLVNDPDKSTKAVEALEGKEKDNGRDSKGFILLRVRTKTPAKIKAKK